MLREAPLKYSARSKPGRNGMICGQPWKPGLEAEHQEQDRDVQKNITKKLSEVLS